MSEFQQSLEKYINPTYATQGLQSLLGYRRHLIELLHHGHLPAHGLSDTIIESILNDLSTMDSNNFEHNIGFGEREGRIYSSIIRRRYFGLAHGIGRSGDITEVQPKAAGSSIMYKLTNKMALDALALAGLTSCKYGLTVPLATGMSLSLCMSSFRDERPHGKLVIWSRIDQKSCFKSILLAGFQPIIIDQVVVNGELQTNVEGIKVALETYGDEVLCVMSTTSCFAPRQPDQVDEIAKLCQRLAVPHLINNAYGLQCRIITKLINRAATIGRVDAVVQSTDKNFLVPVGGAIIASPSADVIARISAKYPGRASAAPIQDLFITFLSLGKSGYSELLSLRNEQVLFVSNYLRTYSSSFHGIVLSCPKNTISYAITLASLQTHPNHASFFGSMLFQRGISGCRVVCPVNKVTNIAGYSFVNWGSHVYTFSTTYLTVAVAIGLTNKEIETFCSKLIKITTLFEKRFDHPSTTQLELQEDKTEQESEIVAAS